jgi:hypothetical protein
LLALIAGIALAAFFLQMVIAGQMFPPGRRRRSLGGGDSVFLAIMGESKIPRR